MRQTAFTADLHIGHKNIIKYCNRPWAKDPLNPTKDETMAMDWDLVRFWNSVVKPGSDVYILGDVAYCTEEEHVLEVLIAMYGEKHVIEGNHDRWSDSKRTKPGIARRLHEQYPNLFASYTPGYLETAIEGQEIVMCHYAMRSWHHDTRGVWNLYGHTHATLEPFGKSVDVGIDNAHNVAPGAWYRPLTFEEIKTYMDARAIGSHPIFENYRPGHPEIEHLQVIGGTNGNQGQDQTGPTVCLAEQEASEEDSEADI